MLREILDQMPRKSPSRSVIEPRTQARGVLRALDRLYPDSRCALEHRGPFQLLVATILSAQCTDVRVNMVTPALFARYPNPAHLANADASELESLIRSTGFFRSKAKSLTGMASRLVSHHGGKVPDDLDALTALPGVGRKTANVVLGVAFEAASGIVVDTHVKRLANRLGLTKSNDPKIIERELIEIVPKKSWIRLSHQLIEHGRKVCIARKPKCSACELAAICPRQGVTNSA
jgi:endonuclease III